MANFEAQIRASFLDVAGMVLSCVRADIVEDTGNLGFIREWINRASGMPSKPAIRQPGDPVPTYLGGRFSNPRNLTVATQPSLVFTGGGEKRASFVRANNSFLETELIGADFPDAPGQPLAIGYQFTKGGDASNGQVICTDSPNEDFKASRRNGAGDAQIDSAGLTTVAGDHADGTFLYTGLTGGTSLWERDGAAYGVGASAAEQILSGSKLYLGRDTAGNYLDGILDGIHIWMAELSPLTQDLIWQTLNADGTDFATITRAVLVNTVWSDITGDSLLDQYDRLRPLTGLPHRFIKATPGRIQVAAAVDGLVLPDAQLGGELFTYNWIEIATGAPAPALLQDAGWSAVADFTLPDTGHYTLDVIRASGGSIILHIDVEP